MNKRYSMIGWVAVAAVVATYGLIVLGAIVRTSGSGLGCPDWPLCYGQFVPPPVITAWIEFSHRVAASLIVVLVLTTAGLIWWNDRRLTLRMKLVSVAIALLGIEVVLGGITVLMELPPVIVAVHLTNALMILGLMVIVSLLLRRPQPASSGVEDSRLLRPVLWSLVATLAVLIIGTVVTGTSAGYACTQWPTCSGSWLFSLNPLAVLHMTHRIGVVVAGILLLWTTWLTYRRHTSRALRRAATAASTMYVAEIMVGAVNVWTLFNTWVNALHLALAALIWALLVAMLYYTYQERLSREKVPSALEQTSSPANQPSEYAGSSAL